MAMGIGLGKLDVPKPLWKLASSLSSALEPSIDMFSDEWDILDWKERPGNLTKLTLHFSRIKNVELKLIAKIYIASKRVQGGTSDAGALTNLNSLLKLDLVMGDKGIAKLNLLDFVAVENIYRARGMTGKISVLTQLQAFSKWMQKRLGLRIFYRAPKGRAEYGRHGSEVGKEKKLLPTEIFRDLFRLAAHQDLPFRDKFFISALVINTAIGGRVNELACLPLDCLVEQEGRWVLKVFPEKGGKLFHRPFPQELYPAVRAAVDFITEHTAQGRNVVRLVRSSPELDWTKIKKSPESLRYYIQKFAADWTKQFSLYTPRGSYFHTTAQFVDAVGLLDRFKEVSKAAAYLGTSPGVFNKLLRSQISMSEKIYLYEATKLKLVPLTEEVANWKLKLRMHPHAVSRTRVQKLCEATIAHKPWMQKIVDEVLDEALLYQLHDKIFPFECDSVFESLYFRKVLPTVRKHGVSLLEPEDSLFIISRNLLTYSKSTKSKEFRRVSDSVLKNWLDTTAEREGSLFKRFNIIDPRTGTAAEFCWHDIRHWLNTVYKQGGLSDAQVNMILGRTDFSQGQVYDHTPALSRSLIIQQMTQRVREDKAVGLIQTTFNKLKIEDRKGAEDYLAAAVRVINPMPHGGCAHNLALKPCQHSLSCFAKGVDGKPCGDLIVDSKDEAQLLEIQNLARNAGLMKAHIVNAGGASSSQYNHFDTVERSAQSLLQKVSKKL
ncbi:hypothetical protein NF675_04440 [Pseudomonas siliginis]|uniref:hypothetical protein n=1 Tax=Pseudomonas siliginis TaxID=2842346 RepID=UPI0020926B0A|nr:hypothetical protein [Pseudomonas siliginis]UST75342.1 hypothetical protein NF675_04440 [Pseudomonas siliginis]